jgi:hypothetical protein
LSGNRYLLFLISAILYVVIWVVLYPYFQYLLDADAVGYLTVANRVANNDWLKSVNGLWSPLNSWLLVPFIKNGWDAFRSALLLNAIFCFGILGCVHVLLHRFVTSGFFITMISVTVPIVLVYYSYFQVFGDALQLLFVCIYLIIITSKNFWGNVKKYCLVSIIMGIAFFAKAYSFPFFILHFTAIHAWHWWQTKRLFLIQYAISILLFIFCISPWSFQLFKKYNQFSLTGNAGKLNMSWYLLSHKSFKPEIKILIPPTYSDSPSFWEDPFLSQSICYTPTESVALFARWIARIFHTCLQAVLCINEISCFVIPCLLAMVIFYIRKKNVQALDAIFWAVVIVPIGYLAMHIETRYIWLMMIGAILFAGVLIQKLLHAWQQRLLTIMFCISIIVYPIYNLIAWRNKGKPNFEVAETLQKLGVKNQKFVTNSRDLGNMWVAAYLSKNQMYSIENFSFSAAALQAELRQYQVAYYIQLQSDPALEIANKTVLFNNPDFIIYQIKELP